MNTHLKIWIALVALFAFSIAQADALKEDTLDKLIILSGIDSQTKDTASGAMQMLAQTPLASADTAELKQLISSMSDYNQLIDAQRKHLSKALSEEQAQKLISWYESNFGNRIARAEELASTPESMQSLAKNRASLLSDPERVQLIEELMLALNTKEASLKIQKMISTTVMAAMSKMQAPNAPVDLEQIGLMIDQQTASLSAMMDENWRLLALNAYADFSVTEIKDYIAVLKKPEMKALNDATLSAMLEPMSTGLEQFIRGQAAL